MGEQAGEKTEEPTPHKLQEARKKGQVAKSKEITTALLVLVSFQVFKNVAVDMWYRLVGFAQFMFRQIEHSQYLLDAAYGNTITLHAIRTFLRIMLPIFLVTFLGMIIPKNF